MRYQITCDSITKGYGRQLLFRDFSINLQTGDSLAIKGPNGCGKSTLLDVMARLQKPDRGMVTYRCANQDMDFDVLRKIIGYCSPRIFPYNDLTAQETLDFIRHDNTTSAKVEYLLELFNMQDHIHKPVAHYSTGMLQRLRCLFALVNDPPIFILDEPGSNLDENGKNALYTYIKATQKEKILIIASNDDYELRLCVKDIDLAKTVKQKP